MIASGTTQNEGFDMLVKSGQNRIDEIEKFKNTSVSGAKRNIAFVGVSLCLLFLIGLFALQIISGIIAIIFTVVAGLGGIYGIKIVRQLDPVFQQKLKNKKLEMMVSEAKEKAIFQLDNQVLENQQRLVEARKARDAMGAQIAILKGQMDSSDKSSSNHARKRQILDRLELAYGQIKANVVKAAQANSNFENKVNEYKEMQRFADAASEVMQLFSSSGDDKLQDMLSLESFGQIETDFNSALIEIENSASDMTLDESLKNE